jgi:hypothetical protein
MLLLEVLEVLQCYGGGAGGAAGAGGLLVDSGRQGRLAVTGPARRS